MINKNQGLDFVGEEKNKDVKKGVPPSPSFLDWWSAVRIAPLMSNIRREFDTSCHLQQSARDRAPVNHDPDVLSWRSKLRSHQWRAFSPSCTISGETVMNPTALQTAKRRMTDWIRTSWLEFSDTVPKIPHKQERISFDLPPPVTIRIASNLFQSPNPPTNQQPNL